MHWEQRGEVVTSEPRAIARSIFCCVLPLAIFVGVDERYSDALCPAFTCRSSSAGQAEPVAAKIADSLQELAQIAAPGRTAGATP